MRSSASDWLSNTDVQTGTIQATNFRPSEIGIQDALEFITKRNLTNDNCTTLASTQMHETSYQDMNPLQSDYRTALIQNATRSVMNHLQASDLTDNPSYVDSNDNVAYDASVNGNIATRKAQKLLSKRGSKRLRKAPNDVPQAAPRTVPGTA